MAKDDPTIFNADGLQTIDRDTLAVPETRLADPRSVQDFARRMIENDTARSRKRALVNGLVNGNAPYRASALKEAGRAGACNVNFGIARAYLESGSGAFYDLFSEAPGYVTIKTDHGTPEERELWSNILSKEADRIFRSEKTWDYNMQRSQQEMTLHGCGPMLFEDNYCVFPVSVLCGDLKVPEFTKSDTAYWDGCGVFKQYYPPQLYDFIKNEKAAAKVGWNVDYVKRVIANAMNVLQQPGVIYDWEFFQQELKNNCLNFFDDTKVSRLVHVFWKEFDGRITHAIVEQETTVANGDPTYGRKVPVDDKNTDVQFLYRKIGRYKSWQEALHPMYFDRGDAGYHHSVTGLGVKMYSAMEYENRLICNLCDKAFSPKMMFKPNSTEQAQKFQLAVMGDYAVLPAGFEPMQGAISGFMDEGLAMHQTISQVLQSNLSSYRQQIPMREKGNPATKYEKQLEASQQSALNKTQFNRYYAQLDMLYSEMYRRLSNLNTSDPKAEEFQKRCLEQGVPKLAMAKVALVQATRVVGQGSAFMRKQAIDSLFGVAGALPEDGRQNLVDDKIAAEAGQAAVLRYNPKKTQATLPGDQEAEAAQWIACMKVGISPIVTSSQNPVVYATSFMQAATQALNSLQQGADPMEVLSFLEICGPAIAAHLQRFSMDPTRQQVFKVLSEQWKVLAGLVDDLKKMVMQMQEQAAQQQQKTAQALSDQQLKTLETMSNIKTKEIKNAASMKQRAESHSQKMAQGLQKMALTDATTANQILIDKAKAESEKATAEVSTD